MDDFELHAICEVCRKQIRWGDSHVSIVRNVEEVDNEGAIHCVDSVALASLCFSCGHRYPERAIRVVFDTPSN